jgi:periplasmic divalent cation tolerance protein
MDFSSVYITTKDRGEAERVGRLLVEERLAACANVFDRVHSIYRWEGNVEEGDEAAVIVKTRSELVDRIVKRVAEVHSYEVPCVVSWRIDNGNPSFLQWIADSTSPTP